MDSMKKAITAMMNQPEQVEASIAFVTEKIGAFLKKRERVSQFIR